MLDASVGRWLEPQHSGIGGIADDPVAFGRARRAGSRRDRHIRRLLEGHARTRSRRRGYTRISRGRTQMISAALFGQTSKRTRMNKTIIAAMVVVAPALAACGQGVSQPQTAAPPPPQVTIAKPASKMIADQDEYVGRFVAVESVEVRARVPGYLDRIHFQDGQLVKAGDLLFTIDRRPFQIALAQAQASLAQAKSTLAFAESDLARAQGLTVGAVITQQTFDQRTQAKRTAEASVAAQQAAERQAALDLEFTELRAPVAGRIGDRRVSIGNLVTGGTSGNTSLLATIESIDPIRFEFTLDEASYLRYGRASKDGADAPDRGLTVPVKLKLIDEPRFSHEGKMDFVDNAIDRSFGSIRARAVFANPNSTFTPGMFARVQVAAGPPGD